MEIGCLQLLYAFQKMFAALDQILCSETTRTRSEQPDAEVSLSDGYTTLEVLLSDGYTTLETLKRAPDELYGL